MTRGKTLIVANLVLMICLLFLLVTKGAAVELQLPPMPPSIEELTNGKVKIGDLITKDNVDQIKDYLSAGIYECVTGGMVLRMANNLPPEKLNPKKYLEATEDNKGKAVIDDHVVVRLSDGSEWPGGMPFTDPKTGLEVMGYARWGHAFDDFDFAYPLYYVNKNGKRYKSATVRAFKIYTDGRIKCAPLGSVPGLEDEHYRMITAFSEPLELKGLGMLNINYDDDAAKYDVGFMYLPAFKRTIRVSATTFQDNLGGSDFTYGDPEGLREPFGTWKFKLIGKEFMLVGEPVRAQQPILDSSGKIIDPHLKWDVGERYPRLGWTINPVYVVEATPKDSGHLYSKKILYVNAPYFASSVSNPIASADIYDRTGELWKCFYDGRGGSFTHEDGDYYTVSTDWSMQDLHSGHSSHFGGKITGMDEGTHPEFLSLKTLLQIGR